MMPPHRSACLSLIPALAPTHTHTLPPFPPIRQSLGKTGLNIILQGPTPQIEVDASIRGEVVLAFFETTAGASRHIGRTMTGDPAVVAPHVVHPHHLGGTMYSISPSGSADRLAASCAIHMALTMLHANYELHSTLGDGESVSVVLPGTHINSMRSLLSY